MHSAIHTCIYQSSHVPIHPSMQSKNSENRHAQRNFWFGTCSHSCFHWRVEKERDLREKIQKLPFGLCSLSLYIPIYLHVYMHTHTYIYIYIYTCQSGILFRNDFKCDSKKTNMARRLIKYLLQKKNNIIFFLIVFRSIKSHFLQVFVLVFGP